MLVSGENLVLRLLASCKENLIERGNLWKEARKVQEGGHPKNSDDVNKFNVAMDDGNIDFKNSGVSNAMVKRSHGINIQNLIQQIENHPQRETLQSDLHNIVRSIPAVESQKMRLWLLGILNYAR